MQSSITQGNSGFSFWKKIIYIGLFFAVAPVALVASLISLSSVSSKPSLEPKPVKIAYKRQDDSGVQVFASLPHEFPSVSGEVIYNDARVEIIRQYLDANRSELTPYAGFIVENADKYELDYRLITAIAQKESGLCNVIPEGSHNCWGWGITSEGTLYFDSYEEGIETVSRGLKKFYKDVGYITVPEIMSKWIPHSPGGVWATDVLGYMDSIEN